MNEWRHDDDERQWEYGYYDLPRERWVSYGWLVTDEAIERVAHPAVLARRLWSSLGSLPPPLAEYEPPPVPVVYAGCDYVIPALPVPLTCGQDQRSEPVSETEAGITVIGKAGDRHEYDADAWHKDDDGHLLVTRDGRNVAIFAPGQGEVMPSEPVSDDR